MKLSKLDIIKLIYSEYINEAIFNKLVAKFNRLPEFEFIRLAEQTLNQRLTIARKNTYLIG